MLLLQSCAAGTAVAHCAGKSSSKAFTSTIAQPLRQRLPQLQTASGNSSSSSTTSQPRRCRAAAAVRVAAMAVDTQTKSVSGTMAELKKQGK